MAFPTVVSLTTTNDDTVLDTDHSGSYPATVNSGDLLLVACVTFNPASAGNDTQVTPTDTDYENPTVFQTTVGGGTTIRAHIFAKIADGTEGGDTFDCTTDVNTRMSFQIARITGHHNWLPGGDINDTISSARSAAEAVNNTSNPPAVTASWGSDDNLFWYFAIHADDNASVNSYSTNYTNGTHTTPNRGTDQNYGIASARRELASASDDPGNHVWSEVEGHNEITIVIRPGTAETEFTTTDIAHAHALDQASIAQDYVFSCADVSHAHSLDQVSISANQVLQPDDIAHAHALDEVVVGANQTFTATDIAHAHSLDQAFLVQPLTFEINEVAHAHSLDQATISQNQTVVFPVIQSKTVTHDTVLDTPHTADYPATINAGDLLLVLIVNGLTPAGNPGTLTPVDTGFVKPPNGETTFGAGTTIRGHVFAKIAAGTEGGGTFQFNTSQACRTTVQIWRITNFFDYSAGSISDAIICARSAAEAINATSNPPAVTAPWGVAANLFGFLAIHADDNASVNSFPANYVDGIHSTQNRGTNQNFGIATAHRFLAAATDDPGNLTWSETEGHNEITFVIRPAGAYTFSQDDVANAHSLDVSTISQNHDFDFNDIAHAHSLDATTITRSFDLTQNDVAHAHSLDSASINQVHAVSPVDVAHAHSLDSATMAQNQVFSGAGIQHGHLLDTTTMAQNQVFSPDAIAHTHSLDATTIIVDTTFSQNDVENAHSLDQATMAQDHVFSCNDIAHAHSLDATTINQDYVFNGNGLDHSHSLDVTSIVQGYGLQPDDIVHAHSVEESVLDIFGRFTLTDIAHAHSLDATTIIENHDFSIDSLAHAHALDAVTISQNHAIALDAIAHAHALDQATVAQNHNIVVNGVDHAHALDTTTISQNHQILCAEISHGHSLDVASMAQNYAFLLVSLDHAHSLDVTTISQNHAISANGVLHSHLLDACQITQIQTFSINDIQHSHALDSCVVSAFREFITNSLNHSHSLDATSYQYDYTIITDEVSHGMTLDTASIEYAGGAPFFRRRNIGSRLRTRNID